MSDIPRYLVSLNAMTAWRDNAMVTDQIGMVTYADHVEALRQATALATPETVAQAGYWYEQGQRDVFALHAEWTVAGMCKPDCLPCQRLTELIVERSKGYDEGQREALADAVQIVEELPCKCNEGVDYCDGQTDAIAAIMTLAKGDQR